MSQPSGSNIICALCPKPITSSGRSREHIIPQSLGGTLTVGSFICHDCNSSRGGTWDAELMNQLRYFCLKFDIARQKGPTPSYVFRTASGESVRMHSGGRLSAGKPTFKKTCTVDGIRYEISAGTYEELRTIIRDLKKHHPEIDVDKFVQEVQTSAVFSSDPLEIAPYLLFDESVCKSMVKSALALVFRAGVDTGSSAEVAVSYLRGESRTRCCYPWYEKDAIANREVGAPIHCVHVMGDPASGMLLAYIEVFGFVRMVACLCDSYRGIEFSDTYAVNPANGEPQQLSVNIDSSMIDAAAGQSSETIPDRVARAMLPVLHEGTIFERSLAVSRSITEECADTVFSYIRDGRGSGLTDAESCELRSRIMKAVVPHIRQYTRPMKIPKGNVGEGGRFYGDTDGVEWV